ncbi:MAG: hypothetical protein ACPGJS_23115 [Flammeovirgaceae bacterium]
MLADLVFFIFMAFLAIPTIGAYYAHSRGRSFWLWFAIGTFLPLISYFILLLLPDKKEPIEPELKKLRIDLGMLGTSPNIPLNDRWRKRILKGPVQHIKFQSTVAQDHRLGKRLKVLIDDRDLIDLVKQTERPFAKKEEVGIQAKDYIGLPFELALSPSEHLIGNTAINYTAPKNRSILLVDKETGKSENWAFSAEIRVYRRHVVWCNFMQLQRAKTWRYKKLGIFVFNKLQYIDALQELMKVRD